MKADENVINGVLKVGGSSTFWPPMMCISEWNPCTLRVESIYSKGGIPVAAHRDIERRKRGRVRLRGEWRMEGNITV